MAQDCEKLEEFQNMSACEPIPNNKIVAIAILGSNATITDFGDNSQWLTALNSGNAVMLKDVNGTYDGGALTMGAGYGVKLERVTGGKHKITLMTAFLVKNIAFFNKLIDAKTKGFVFITGSGNTQVMHFVKTDATFAPKMPVTAELDKDREFNCDISWQSKYMPEAIETIPAVFETELPEAPTALEETATSSSGFTANWATATGATSYLLDISTTPTFNAGTFIAGYTAKSVTGTTQVVTGLTANTTYYYRLKSKNFLGTSSYSNVISAQTNP